MKTRLFWLITLGCGMLCGHAVAADQPRYDITRTTMAMEFKTVDSRLDAIADIQLRLLDQTNYIVFKLNGNLSVITAEMADGTSLRYIQDDTDKFEVMVNLGRAMEPGTELSLHLEFAGVFPKSQFDFLRDQGQKAYSYIGDDLIELYGAAFWFPRTGIPWTVPSTKSRPPFPPA